MTGRARTAARVVATLASLTLGLALFVFLVEDVLLYHPTKGGVGPSPGDDVALVAKDGTKLHAWFVKNPAARATVLWLHGNAANIENRREVLLRYRDELPANVLLLDWRGFGKSEGTPSEDGLYQDARAAWHWLAAKTPPEKIVVLGESLGGGPACELATHVKPAGLVLQAAFTSTPDMASRVVPFLPGRLFMRTSYDNLSKVGRLACPKLFLHARQDEVIPFAMGERLFEAAAAPKEHVWFERGGHNDLPWASGVELFQALRGFVEHVVPR